MWQNRHNAVLQNRHSLGKSGLDSPVVCDWIRADLAEFRRLGVPVTGVYLGLECWVTLAGALAAGVQPFELHALGASLAWCGRPLILDLAIPHSAVDVRFPARMDALADCDA